MLTQMVFSLERLLFPVSQAVEARMTVVAMCGAMSQEGVSPCVALPAARFTTPPSFVRRALSMFVQRSEVAERLTTLRTLQLLGHLFQLQCGFRVARVRRQRECGVWEVLVPVGEFGRSICQFVFWIGRGRGRQRQRLCNRIHLLPLVNIGADREIEWLIKLGAELQECWLIDQCSIGPPTVQV
jgi:hypothetical protein